ncbi:MAG: hypothetical protein JSS67_03650 [Bacteroidetes bacterium]|nr:hypothetical protein [Bacteroidota bacterium]
MLKRILSIFLFPALIFAQAPTVSVPTRGALTRALTIAEADSIGTTLQHQVNASARSWGYRETGSSGLIFAYYGGPAWNGTTYTSIADGTVTLTASATNYVERTVAGAVSANTSAWTAGRLPLYLVTTSGSVVTGIVDQRTGLQALTGDVTSSGNVTALATTQAAAHTWSGIQTISNATASSTTGTGALVVTGGVGIGGAVNAASATVTGPSTSWGATPSGGFKTIMGTSSGATWLMYGTSGGTFSAGIQSLDSGGQSRFWTSATNYATISSGSGGTVDLSNLGVVTAGSFSGAGTGLTGTAASLTAGTATVANGLKSATTTVSVSGATAPTSGQVLTATSGTTAVWQTPSGGGAGAFNRIVNGSIYQGLGPWVTSGTTVPVYSSTTATSGTSGSAAMIATGGTVHVTTTGSISQAFSIPAPSGAVTLTYKTACYYSAPSFNSNTGSVKVYIYNASTGAETLVATNSLTATGSSPSFTNQSVTVTTNITGAGEWGVRFELMADSDNSGGTGTKTTTTLVDDVALVI